MSEAAPDRRLPPVVILAGGFGTRIQAALPGVPKPMAPAAGRPFIEWVVRFFARHGATEFILSTGYLAGQIDRHFAAQPVPGVRVRCSAETTPLGTAGGFLHCLSDGPSVTGTWIVANGDSLVFADPHSVVAALQAGAAPAAVLGLAVEDASRYGTLECDSAGRLTAFQEKRPGSGVINSGVYAFTGAALQGLPARRPLSFETDVFPVLAARRQVAVTRTVAAFLDIGTPASLVEAEQFILQHRSEFLP
jgi:D-glycero-alpha-D-manno-heptose 1-phosphate guanylyltransferase